MVAPDLIIIGGGVIGAACARCLSHQGLGVTVLEPGPGSGAASEAAAGMLAPLAEAGEDDPILSLAVRGRDLYHELAPALAEETGIDVGLWTDGILQLAFTEAEVDEAKRRIAWQRQMGFASDWITPDELGELIPSVNPDALGAAIAPEDGGLRSTALRRALLESAARSGAKIRRERATEIVIRDGRVTAVRTTRRSSRGIRCGAVVMAAGCWSGEVAGPPHPIRVKPIRGQVSAYRWPRHDPPAIVYGGGGYLVAREGEVLVGSTMEDVGFDAGVTEAGTTQIASGAARVCPALAGLQPTRSWAGLRPMTPDGRPLLGVDPDVPNLWYATGHGRAGILLAAITGELLTSLVVGAEIEQDLSPLAPERFWTE